MNQELSVGSIQECQLTCQNGGYCSQISSDESTLLTIFVSGGILEQCVCPPGFSGITCENIAEECHDLKCHNGAPCSLVGGQYLCDCSDADAVSTFAGAMCRKPATSYCGQGDFQNRGFCTNGGLCIDNLSADSGRSMHGGCHCPPEFEGQHCEYLKGMAPNETPYALKDLHSKTSNNTEVAEPTTPSQTEEVAEMKTIITPLRVENQSKSSESGEKRNGVIVEATSPLFQSKEAEIKTVLAPLMVPTKDNKSMSSESTGIVVGAAAVGVAMSIFGIAGLVHLRQRSRRNRSNRDLLDRRSYVDQTPIRVREMAEVENLEAGDEYVDDEDLHSISECSLEEIELEDNEVASNYREYLQSIRDGGYETYFDHEPDFTNIIGPLPSRSIG